LGYTLLCYRWTENLTDAKERERGLRWKLRLLTPWTETPLIFGSTESSPKEKNILGNTKEEEADIAKLNVDNFEKISLDRFSGYYLPNEEFCVCR